MTQSSSISASASTSDSLHVSLLAHLSLPAAQPTSASVNTVSLMTLTITQTNLKSDPTTTTSTSNWTTSEAWIHHYINDGTTVSNSSQSDHLLAESTYERAYMAMVASWIMLAIILILIPSTIAWYFFGRTWLEDGLLRKRKQRITKEGEKPNNNARDIENSDWDEEVVDNGDVGNSFNVRRELESRSGSLSQHSSLQVEEGSEEPHSQRRLPEFAIEPSTPRSIQSQSRNRNSCPQMSSQEDMGEIVNSVVDNELAAQCTNPSETLAASSFATTSNPPPPYRGPFRIMNPSGEPEWGPRSVSFLSASSLQSPLNVRQSSFFFPAPAIVQQLSISQQYNRAPQRAPEFEGSMRRTRLFPGLITVRYPFQPTKPDELKVEKGKNVHVLGIFDDGWCTCWSGNGTKAGILPLACLCLEGSVIEVLAQGVPHQAHVQQLAAGIEDTVLVNADSRLDKDEGEGGPQEDITQEREELDENSTISECIALQGS